MKLGIDTETHLIRRGLLAPPLVCLQLAGSEAPPAWLPPEGPWCVYAPPPAAAGAVGVRWSCVIGAPLVEALGPHVLAGNELCAANVAYDLLVLHLHASWDLDAIFDAIAEGRVRDVACTDRLRAVAEGERTPDGRIPTASLGALVERYLGVEIPKGEETWRTRYAELDGIPVADWPDDALTYAADDPAWHLAVDLLQCAHPPVAPDLEPGYPPGWEREVRAAWALHLAAAWGLRADPEAVAWLEGEWDRRIGASVRAGQAGGWVRGSGGEVLPAADRVGYLQRIYDLAEGGAPPGAYTGRGKLSTSVAAVRKALQLRRFGELDPYERDEWAAAQAALRPIADAGREETLDTAALRAIVEETYLRAGQEPPRTEPSATYPEGQISTARGTLARVALLPGAPPTLKDYSAGLASGKHRAVWGEALRAAALGPLTSSPSHLVASGRTAWSKPPLQQPPRTGHVRECFVPTDGFVYASVDYGTAELVALAQVHLWLGLDDTMAQAIRAGQDLHLRLAAALLGTTYDDAYARYKAEDPEVAGAFGARALAKPANFGYPGGLGVATFREYAWGTYDLDIPEPTAKDLRDAWFQAWPAMSGYFSWVNAQLNAGGGTFQAVQFVSGRRRGGCGYCDGANTFFQGLIGDVSKDALWRVQRECWTGRTPEGEPSPLEGSRPLLLLHDEIILEAPVVVAPEAAERLSVVMVEAARDHIPDVPMKAEPALCDRWTKDPKPIRDPATGRLLPVRVRAPHQAAP